MSNTVLYREFTWQEWVDTAKRQGISKSQQGRSLRKQREWTQATYDEAIDMAAGKGYEDAIPEAEAMVGHIEMDLEGSMQSGFEITFDVSGSFVDIGRYLSNDPECMMDALPIKTMRTGRVLKVAVPICYSARTDKDIILRRGAAVMALVDCFAKKQHPMEIWAVHACHGDARGSTVRPRMVYSIKVQEADSPLDMGRIMFALAHPAMLRQLGFSVQDTESYEIKRKFDIGAAYGHPKFAIELEDLEPIAVENAVILPELELRDRKWESDEYAVEWIREQLTRIEEGSN